MKNKRKYYYNKQATTNNGNGTGLLKLISLLLVGIFAFYALTTFKSCGSSNSDIDTSIYTDEDDIQNIEDYSDIENIYSDEELLNEYRVVLKKDNYDEIKSDIEELNTDIVNAERVKTTLEQEYNTKRLELLTQLTEYGYTTKLANVLSDSNNVTIDDNLTMHWNTGVFSDYNFTSIDNLPVDSELMLIISDYQVLSNLINELLNIQIEIKNKQYEIYQKENQLKDKKDELTEALLTAEFNMTMAEADDYLFVRFCPENDLYKCNYGLIEDKNDNLVKYYYIFKINREYNTYNKLTDVTMSYNGIFVKYRGSDWWLPDDHSYRTYDNYNSMVRRSSLLGWMFGSAYKPYGETTWAELEKVVINELMAIYSGSIKDNTIKPVFANNEADYILQFGGLKENIELIVSNLERVIAKIYLNMHYTMKQQKLDNVIPEVPRHLSCTNLSWWLSEHTVSLEGSDDNLSWSDKIILLLINELPKAVEYQSYIDYTKNLYDSENLEEYIDLYYIEKDTAFKTTHYIYEHFQQDTELHLFKNQINFENIVDVNVNLVIHYAKDTSGDYARLGLSNGYIYKQSDLADLLKWVKYYRR